MNEIPYWKLNTEYISIRYCILTIRHLFSIVFRFFRPSQFWDLKCSFSRCCYISLWWWKLLLSRGIPSQYAAECLVAVVWQYFVAVLCLFNVWYFGTLCLLFATAWRQWYIWMIYMRNILGFMLRHTKIYIFLRWQFFFRLIFDRNKKVFRF